MPGNDDDDDVDDDDGNDRFLAATIQLYTHSFLITQTLTSSQ